MCGRYVMRHEYDAWSEIGLRWPVDGAFSWQPRYNIAPGQWAPVVVGGEAPMIRMLRWGLVPHWAKDPSIGSRLINARGETLTTKPAFASAFKHRRCIVPASGFYEWQKRGSQKAPMHITPTEAAWLPMAGLWERYTDADERVLETFCVVTTRPNELMTSIHLRMPAILRTEDVERWLAPGPIDEATLTKLLEPIPSESLEAYEVSPRVNRPANDTSECIERVTSLTPRLPGID
jgi:putative SOS response-associated peptidase YedK